jgi:hypothetical protein
VRSRRRRVHRSATQPGPGRRHRHGKTHLTIAIARSCILSGSRGSLRFAATQTSLKGLRPDALSRRIGARPSSIDTRFGHEYQRSKYGTRVPCNEQDREGLKFEGSCTREGCSASGRDRVRTWPFHRGSPRCLPLRADARTDDCAISNEGRSTKLGNFAALQLRKSRGK